MLTLACVAGLVGLQPSSIAQSAAQAKAFAPACSVSAGADETVALSRLETYHRLQTPVDIRFTDHPLHDVIRYLSLVADAPIDAFWLDQSTLESGGEASPVGLDPMTAITLDTTDLTVLQALEATLELASMTQRLEWGATWQFSPTGSIEVGPRECLNRAVACRTEVYDVQDLLTVLPDSPEAVRLDPSTAGQPVGPGADQWMFPSDNEPIRAFSRPARASELRSLILAVVEPEQWADAGGTSTIRVFDQAALVIHAPDYVHRALVGPLGEGIQTESD